MKKIFQILFAVLLMSAVATSCRKDKDENQTDEETQSSQDMMVTENEYTDVQNISDEANTGSLKSYRLSQSTGILNGCATVIRDTINPADEDTITIDFGTGCQGKDGKTRSGKIIVTYTGKYRDAGTNIVITLDNYRVNNHLLNGTKTIHNNGKNAAGHTNWDITVQGKAILANGAELTRISQHNREMIEGEDTPDRSDDVYSITGTASGTNKKGSYNAVITTPLIKKTTCRNFTAGVLEFTPENKPTRIIDFSLNANCSGKCKVKIHGKRGIIEKEIDLF